MYYTTRHSSTITIVLLMALFGLGRVLDAQDYVGIFRQCAEVLRQHPYVEWELHVSVYRSAADPRPIDTSSYRYSIARDRLAIHSSKLVVIRTPQYSLVVNHLLQTIEWTAAAKDAQLAALRAEFARAIDQAPTISYPLQNIPLDTTEVLVIVDSCEDQTIEVYLFPRGGDVVRALYVVDGVHHVVQRAELYFRPWYKEITGERVVYRYRNYRFSDRVPERAFSVKPYLRPHRGSYTPTEAYANYQLIIH